MPKIFKPNKLHTTITQLYKIVKLRGESSSQAQAQIDYYVRNGYLTRRMKDQAKLIIDKEWDKIKPKRVEKTHYLYAVSNGKFIKIGMSSCVDKRIKALQTASPSKLKKIWTCYAGEDDKSARKNEKRLHRAIKKHSVNGEWFHSDCMDIVYGWKVKSTSAKLHQKAVEANEALDNEFYKIMSE